MKKIIFIIFCLCSIDVTCAASLEYAYLPYYAKCTKNGIDKIVQVKKVYDKDTNEVVFNIDYTNYLVEDNYKKFSEVNKMHYGNYYDYINSFNSMVYYGYNENKSDKNYFYTQLIVWNSISNVQILIVDDEGNEMPDMMNEFRTLWNKSKLHDVVPSFGGKQYDINIGDSLTVKYNSINKVLDNPIIDGLSFKNEGKELYVYGEKVGHYKVELIKDYNNINYSYSNGNTYYWQNLGGPGDIHNYFYINVYGVNLRIKENLLGFNGKIGDAKLGNSKYELYIDDNLEMVINNLTNNVVKVNESYLLKDISNNDGIINVDDIEINTLTEDYELVINKKVITKNISIDVLDEFTYEIYLKSNNELYEIIDNNTDLITLPYGLYYLKSKDNDFYQEIEVFNNIDDILLINNSVDEKSDTTIEKVENIELEDSKVEELKEENIIEKVENEDEFIISNPKTVDNISLYIALLLINLGLICILYKCYNLIS